MNSIRKICVFCGSGTGTEPAFERAAVRLGTILAEAGIGLVYGGGKRGLMGLAAQAVLDGGGHVTGIIPEFLVHRERMLDAVQELVIVDDMHTRKRLMFERADAFVALPGGIGTLEELVEQLTWVQLDRHAKPVLIANITGFWRPLLSLLDHMREHAFISPALDVKYLVADDVEAVLPLLRCAVERQPEGFLDRALATPV